MNGHKPPSPASTLRSLGQTLLENAGGQTPARQTPAPRVPQGEPPAGGAAALAARESELGLLRQQLASLSADFRFNLRLLEERDLELERQEAVLAGLREAAAAKELALAETKRVLAERDAALREKEGRLAVLEERQRQTMDLCERQVADARSSRDEEVSKLEAKYASLEEQLTQRMATVESVAAREKADIIAGYERQINRAVAAERESRAAALAARQEAELARSQLQRAEARVGEQELAMQRMVTQFEGALARLQQLEGQYSALAAESSAAERARTGRIQQLELEVDALRATNTALQGEADSAVTGLAQQLQEREQQVAELKQRYHRTSLDNADLTDSITQLKRELQQARDQAREAEGDLQAARDRCSQAQAALDRECTAHAQTQGLLETARLYLETAKRDGEAQAQEAAALRESVALLEAQCLDAAKALEAAQAKLRASDQRLQLLGEQVEQERASHARALAAQEAQLLAVVQEEKAALQEALDLANRQLQQSYTDVETLRLQLDHARLLAPPPPLTAPRSADPPPQRQQEQQARLVPSRTLRAGSLGPAGLGNAALQHQQQQRRLGQAAGPAASGSSASFQEAAGAGRDPYPTPAGSLEEAYEADAASSVSGDVFSDVGDGFDSARGLGPAPARQHATSRFAPAAAGGRAAQEQGAGARSGAVATATSSLYQQQLHQHIDSLTTKLGSFERAVERARHAGTQAASQVVQSAEELPQALQRRQSEVAEGALKKKLARERENFFKERQRLDEELAEKERLLQEREHELQRLQKERDAEALRQKQEALQQREAELQQLARHLQEQQAQQAQQQQQGAAAVSVPASVSGSAPPSPGCLPPQQQHQRQRGGRSAPASVTGTVPPSPDLPMQHAVPSTYHRAQQGESQMQQARAPTAAAAGSLRQSNAGAAGLHSSSGQGAPTSGASSLRSSLAHPAPGAGPWAGPPALQRLSLGSAPRQSVESLHTPRGAAAGTWQQHHYQQQQQQPFSSAGQASLLGLRRNSGGAPSAQPSPTAGLAGAGGALGSLSTAAAAAGMAAGEAGEDPLAKARRQVMLAKSYLRQVADMGGKLSRGAALAEGAPQQ